MTATPDILCIGSVMWDIIGRAPVEMRAGMDVPGRITRLPGGVAANIAMTLARIGLKPAVLTAIGRDAEGEDLIAASQARGMITEYAHRPEGLPTDRYMAVEGANGLIAAVADAHTLEACGAAILAPLADGRLGSAARPWAGPVAVDGNLTVALLSEIAGSPLFAAADLRLAPASPGKAERLRVLLGHPGATFYLNREEAGKIAGVAVRTAAEGAEAVRALGAARVLVTDGAGACADGSAEGVIVAVPPPVTVRRVTGAGDTFMAAHLVAERSGAGRRLALEHALAAAADYISGDVGT
ncbi:PfkB family carbohydrate kinase [Neotabrizicola shimadae]|uniref:Kinase n=1 Tax=Neotabrizicola shimadae TaxID=2807096 RepID=A0A8G0ZY59_9RHOB|nr:PfkB family carbohydrate kinase [Neotabrizicola shimadae]QYZ71091.1 kinase [Neotabrizicola shimadae]